MKIAIFGTGLYADTMLKEKGLQCDLYLDNDPQKWGTLKNGCPIKSPHEVDLLQYFIVIASSYFHEIEKQLIESGLQRYQNYISIDWIFSSELEFIEYLARKVEYPSLTIYNATSNDNFIKYISGYEMVRNVNLAFTIDLIIGKGIDAKQKILLEQVNYVYIENDNITQNFDDQILGENYTVLSVQYCESLKKYHLAEQLTTSYHNQPVFLCHNKLLNFVLGIKYTIISLFDEVLLEYGIPKKGIINVGVHEGQEISMFDKIGFENLVLIEANSEFLPNINEKLKEVNNSLVLNYAVTDRIGKISFNKTSNRGLSSSVLPLKEHSVVHPDVEVTELVEIETTTLDQLHHDFEMVRLSNALYLDVQGAEYLILSAADLLFEQLDVICTEVNFRELYEGCKNIEEIDGYLQLKGFVRIKTLCELNPAWGDAIYINKKYLK